MTEEITGETEDHFWFKLRGILLPHRQMSLQMLLLLVFLII